MLSVYPVRKTKNFNERNIFKGSKKEIYFIIKKNYLTTERQKRFNYEVIHTML